MPFYFYKYKKKKSGNFIKHLLIPVIGILICVMLWINIAPNAKLIGIIWLAIGLVICAINTNFFRKLPSELKLEVDDTED